MFKSSPASMRQRGFTLIEVMVVIVIMGIVISLMVMNIQGIDHRRTLQFKEQFAWELQRIGRESVDQGKILGLKLYPATDVSSARYQVLELKPRQIDANDPAQRYAFSNEQAARYEWSESALFPMVNLPDQVSINIEANRFDQIDRQQAWQDADRVIPLQDISMIWLGNGETRPSQVRFYYQQQALGTPLQVDYLGQVHEE